MGWTNIETETIEGAALQLQRYPWKVWYFGDGIGLRGLQSASQLLQDTRFNSFCYGLVKGWAGRSQPFRKYDQTLPGAECVQLALDFADETLLDQLQVHATWLWGHPKQQDCLVSDDDFPDLIWVDTMAIHAPYFAALGKALKDQRWSERAADLILAQHDVLTDESGLYHHTYNLRTHRCNGVHWGRGNGWALLGLYDVWAMLPETPKREKVCHALQQTLNALIQLQRPNGHWGTIVEDATAYDEPSVAGMYVTVVAQCIRRGIVEGAHFLQSVQKAWKALTLQVDKAGLVRGVSADTWSAMEPEYYRSLPKGELSPWSQGPLLTAALEVAALRNGAGAATKEG